MESISTYSEARNEYLKQLSTWIVPYMIQHYRNLWSEAKRIGGPQREMVVFQEKCAEVPKWNQDVIDLNVGKLLESCRCDYLEELMAAVFIAHTKVLIAIRVSSRHKKLQITLPKLDHFMHRIFSECARSFWKTPFLFLDDQKPIEMQKNLLQAEALCSDSIASAVRSMLPIKNILNEYLSDDVMSSEPVIEEAEEVKKPVSLKKEPVQVEEQVEEQEEEQEQEQEQEKEPELVASPVSGGNLEEKAVQQKQEQTPIQEVEEQVQEKVPALEELVSENTAPILVPELQMPEPEEIVIDTEPAVHFSDYDNVFDESTDPVGSFTYNPKDVEDAPQLLIMEDTPTSLSSAEFVTNLESSGLMDADEILE